jgi:hypothetical protein
VIVCMVAGQVVFVLLMKGTYSARLIPARNNSRIFTTEDRQHFLAG